MKSGIVTIAGRTNIGKSTLLNQIMQMELAIATHKPQTTRHLIKGIYQDRDSRIIFVDSPGMHQANDQLGHQMQKAASVAIQETDLLLLLIDARAGAEIGDIERRIIDLAASAKIPMILAINKIDLIKKEWLLPVIGVYNDYADFKAIVPISAKQNEGVVQLLDEIKNNLPDRGLLVEDDSYTDQTERDLAAEYIRQEIILQIEDEIPYGTAVKIESFEEIFDAQGERSRVKIHAAIFCDKPNHKMILLGRKGRQIAAIGKKSRAKIAEMLDCPCDLMLFVKVREDWKNRHSQLQDLGYISRDLEL